VTKIIATSQKAISSSLSPPSAEVSIGCGVGQCSILRGTISTLCDTRDTVAPILISRRFKIYNHGVVTGIGKRPMDGVGQMQMQSFSSRSSPLLSSAQRVSLLDLLDDEDEAEAEADEENARRGMFSEDPGVTATAAKTRTGRVSRIGSILDDLSGGRNKGAGARFETKSESYGDKAKQSTTDRLFKPNKPSLLDILDNDDDEDDRDRGRRDSAPTRPNTSRDYGKKTSNTSLLDLLDDLDGDDDMASEFRNRQNNMDQRPNNIDSSTFSLQSSILETSDADPKQDIHSSIHTEIAKHARSEKKNNATLSLLDLLEDFDALERETNLSSNNNDLTTSIWDSTTTEPSPQVIDGNGWKKRREFSESLYKLQQQVAISSQPSKKSQGGGDELSSDFSHIFGDDTPTTSLELAHQAIPINVQTPAQAELLFDSLAPHVEQKQLLALLTRMKRFVVSGRVEKDENLVKDDEWDDYEENDGSEDDGAAAPNERSPVGMKIKSGTTFLFTIENHFKSDAPWIRPLIAHFLMGGDISHFVGGKPTNVEKKGGKTTKKKKGKSKKNKTAELDEATEEGVQASQNALSLEASKPVWMDPSFTPNQNQTTFDRDVQTLLRAREKSSVSPPSWCSSLRMAATSSTSSGDADKEHATYSQKDLFAMQQNQQSARSLYCDKSKAAKLQEAEEMATILGDRLPRASFGKLMQTLSKYAPKGKKGSRKKVKKSNKLVGVSAAEAPSDKGTAMKSLESKLHHAVGWHMHLVGLDLAQYLFVYTPTKTVEELELRSSLSFHSGGSIGVSSASADDDRLLASWDEWNTTRLTFVQTLLESQLAYAQRPPKPPRKKTRSEILEEMIPALETLRTRSDGSMIGNAKVVGNHLGRAKRNVHAVFEAQVKQYDFLSDVEERYQAEISKSVFVDNLPIDITVEELELMYGRCGALDRIEIFNQRPDLDPGPLSRADLAIRAREMRGHMKKKTMSSPVHARLLFQEKEGSGLAMGGNLSIFGMVIRRHPCRTHLPTAMTRLFLQDIEGITAINLGELSLRTFVLFLFNFFVATR
jgi:hypothetical protein